VILSAENAASCSFVTPASSTDMSSLSPMWYDQSTIQSTKSLQKTYIQLLSIKNFFLHIIPEEKAHLVILIEIKALSFCKIRDQNIFDVLVAPRIGILDPD